MTPDDPRHGTEAGHEQHLRDNETPCSPCYEEKLKAARRRTKRKTMGHRYTVPIGADVVEKIDRLVSMGATYDEIGNWAGMSESQIWRCHTLGPDSVVYVRTRHKLVAMKPGRILTPIGMTRRIQALMWLGYSCSTIAEESGVHLDTIKDARDQPRQFVAKKVETAVADAYDRLHMRLPNMASRYAKASASRARNYARARNWVPPLAWDQIDDPAETPRDWHYTAPDRATALRDMAELGVGVTEACRRLHVTREGLEKWCQRNGASDVYRTLAARESVVGNQYTREDVA